MQNSAYHFWPENYTCEWALLVQQREPEKKQQEPLKENIGQGQKQPIEAQGKKKGKMPNLVEKTEEEKQQQQLEEKTKPIQIQGKKEKTKKREKKKKKKKGKMSNSAKKMETEKK